MIIKDVLDRNDVREIVEDFVKNMKFSIGTDIVNDIVKYPILGYAAMENEKTVKVKPLFRGSNFNKDGWELKEILPVKAATYSIFFRMPVDMPLIFAFEDITFTKEIVGVEIEGQPHPNWEKLIRKIWVEKLIEIIKKK